MESNMNTSVHCQLNVYIFMRPGKAEQRMSGRHRLHIARMLMPCAFQYRQEASNVTECNIWINKNSQNAFCKVHLMSIYR